MGRRVEMDGNVAREERKRCGPVDAPLWHATALTNQATRFSGRRRGPLNAAHYERVLYIHVIIYPYF